MRALSLFLDCIPFGYFIASGLFCFVLFFFYYFLSLFCFWLLVCFVFNISNKQAADLYPRNVKVRVCILSDKPFNDLKAIRFGHYIVTQPFDTFAV